MWSLPKKGKIRRSFPPTWRNGAISMTIEELRELTSDGDESTDHIAQHDDYSMVIVAWRASHRQTSGVAFKPGTRLDVKCEVCGERVALNQGSQDKIKQGGRVACQECFALATGISTQEMGKRS